MRLYLVDVTDYSGGVSQMFICEDNRRLREFCIFFFGVTSGGKSPEVEWEGSGMAQAYINGGLDVFVHQVNYGNSKDNFDAWDKFPSPGYLAYKERKGAEK